MQYVYPTGFQSHGCGSANRTVLETLAISLCRRCHACVVIIDCNEIRKLRGDGMGATAIAKKLGIGRASVCRVLQD
ncbi:MAG: helix-turn-helix domain-containing protein [Magnetococcales bacterium]|nr:helix-turn-helix domain-containing protein [Magnetococcales bacterium]